MRRISNHNPIGAKDLLQLKANMHMKKFQSIAIFKLQVSQHATKEAVIVCDAHGKLLGNEGCLFDCNKVL